MVVQPMRFLRSPIGDTVIRQSHTPGPWTIGIAQELNPDVTGGLWLPISGFQWHAFAFIAAENNVKEAQANARLIAAAPKLLAACREALSNVNPEQIGVRFTLEQAIADAVGSE